MAHAHKPEQMFTGRMCAQMRPVTLFITVGNNVSTAVFAAALTP